MGGRTKRRLGRAKSFPPSHSSLAVAVLPLFLGGGARNKINTQPDDVAVRARCVWLSAGGWWWLDRTIVLLVVTVEIVLHY